MITYEVRVSDNGSEHWYLNGERHREDGPAVELADGSKFWYINDKRHREDGPAVEYATGFKYWIINGKELSEEEFNLRYPKEMTMTQICELLGKEIILIKEV